MVRIWLQYFCDHPIYTCTSALIVQSHNDREVVALMVLENPTLCGTEIGHTHTFTVVNESTPPQDCITMSCSKDKFLLLK